jgi:hypothetical protein
LFKERHIIFFPDFIFNNGDDPKDKYFIVLKEVDGSLILGSLPTRKNKIPAFVNTDHGCINIEERQYNCYLFKKDKIICKNGFCFDMTTFIYGGDIDQYIIEVMKKDYPQAGVHFKIEGELTDLEYTSILDCLINSNSVKRGIKKMLAA